MFSTASLPNELTGRDGLLSVIVPVYNVEPYLSQCVRSILAQTYPFVEALLIDDGSTDGSGELCDALAREDARVRVFHQQNAGLSAARNKGLDEAKGFWVAFVDSDDYIAPEMCRELIDMCIASNADIGACAFNYVFPDHEQPAGDTGGTSVISRNEAYRLLPAQQTVRFEACGKVYRRGLLEDIRFTPGQVHEDIRFTRLALGRTLRYVYIDKPYYQYRQGRPGSTNTRFPLEKLDSIRECDALYRKLRAEKLFEAADGVAVFTLDHVMRLFHNARECGANAETLRELRRAYRRLYQREKDGNAKLRKLRGLLFAISPDIYDRISTLVHGR